MEEGGGGGVGGVDFVLFSPNGALYCSLRLKYQIEPVHNKLAKKQKQKQTIVTFCEQNIVDLQ